MLHVIVIVLTVIVAVLLIGIVLIQKSKGGGLASQFGGKGSISGVRKNNNRHQTGAWWLSGISAFPSTAAEYTSPKCGSATETRPSQEAAAPAAPAANQFDTPAAAPVATPAATPAETPAGE